MKAVVAAFNQEKALVGAFSVITNLRMELLGALAATLTQVQTSTPAMVSQPQLQQKIVCLENKDWLYSGELSTVEEATALISLMK